MKKNKKIIQNFKRIIILGFFLSVSNAQETEYKLQFSNNSKQSYWWNEQNNFGKYPKQNVIDIFLRHNNSKVEYIINLSNAYSQKNKIKFGETFMKYNFRNSFIKAGKYYRDFSGYMNDDLSSGSMIISHNAQPINKIGFVGKYSFIKNPNLNFRYGIAHGEFEKNEFYSDEPFLHEKFIYLDFSRTKEVEFSIGFVHAAMWAGTTTEIGSDNNIGNQPDTFNDFLKVFISADGPKLPGEPHANALGSHIGIWDFLVQKNNLKFYYQHYFEDTSSLRFANKVDGLWGIEVSNFFKNNTILIEYLDTSNCCIDPPYQNDNYYNNYQYKGGWRYKNMIIGNPFVNHKADREKMHLIHLGLKCNFDKNTIKVLGSKKINFTDEIRYGISYERKFAKFDITLFSTGIGSDRSLGFKINIF